MFGGGRIRSSSDSPLEENGVEPLVPPEKGTASFETTLIDLRPPPSRESSDTLARGTEGSNPFRSTGESVQSSPATFVGYELARLECATIAVPEPPRDRHCSPCLTQSREAAPAPIRAPLGAISTATPDRLRRDGRGQMPREVAAIPRYPTSAVSIIRANRSNSGFQRVSERREV